MWIRFNPSCIVCSIAKTCTKLSNSCRFCSVFFLSLPASLSFLSVWLSFFEQHKTTFPLISFFFFAMLVDEPSAINETKGKNNDSWSDTSAQFFFPFSYFVNHFVPFAQKMVLLISNIKMGPSFNCLLFPFTSCVRKDHRQHL